MQKTLNINLFYSNMDGEAKEKYETLKKKLIEVIDSPENKGLYLGVTVDESEE